MGKGQRASLARAARTATGGTTRGITTAASTQATRKTRSIGGANRRKERVGRRLWNIAGAVDEAEGLPHKDGLGAAQRDGRVERTGSGSGH